MDIIRMTVTLIKNGNSVVECLDLCGILLFERYIRGSQVNITRKTVGF